MTINKPRAGIRMCIGIGNIGLDVVNRRSVHQVGPEHMDDRSLRSVKFHLFYTYARKAKTVGTERRTRGKHPYPLVATQPRRTYRQPLLTPRASFIVPRSSHLGKLPYQPQIVKGIEPMEGFCPTVFGGKDNPSGERRSEATLPRNAEFRRQR